MSKHELSLTINGTPVKAEVEAHRTLVEFLREQMGLTGTKEGCGNGECGACTVILDGQAVRSCLVLAIEANGGELITIEGLAKEPGQLSTIQQAFVDVGAVQCGYCVPGFVLAAKALLDKKLDPSDEEIADAFSGHLCRCAIYPSYFEAVRLAAQRMKKS